MSKLECNKFIIINILALFFFQFATVPSSMIVHGRFCSRSRIYSNYKKILPSDVPLTCVCKQLHYSCKKCTFCAFILFGSAFSIWDINWGKAFLCFRVLVLSRFFHHSKFPAILRHVIVHRYSIFCCKFTSHKRMFSHHEPFLCANTLSLNSD